MRLAFKLFGWDQINFNLGLIFSIAGAGSDFFVRVRHDRMYI